MRVVVIGGSGHVGTYLVPLLVEAGHEVISLSRSNKEPYQPHYAWNEVHKIMVDRETEELAGTFGKFVNKLKPDIVIDLICFKIASVCQLVDALKNNIGHFLHCGTLWVHGYSTEVPVTEDQPRHPFGEYGIQKAAIEEYLLKEAWVKSFPATVLHPGHIVGAGWVPVNPAGNYNTEVFIKLAGGKELILPNIGMETLHHVHAYDVAQIFIKAINHRNNAVGESFHVVSPKALTLRGYAEKVSSWFGKTANVKYLPWEEWRITVSEEDAGITWDHIAHSPNFSIEKAKRLLDYQPRYSSLQAIYESVSWLIENKVIKL